MTVEDIRVPSPVSALAVADESGPRLVVVCAIGLALAVGLAARFATVSPMWLDEALTVNIARLPLADIPEALRHDGAPPLYYLALHGWMGLVGSGDVAVRALSGLLAAASLPLMWLAGRRLARRHQPTGRRLAWAATLLLASSPFAIRYATEVRMYSLVVLLVLAGFLALDTVLHDPVPTDPGPGDPAHSGDPAHYGDPAPGDRGHSGDPGSGDPGSGEAVGGRRSRWATTVLGVVTGLLLLTHYWSFFLVAAVAILLVLRGRDTDPSRRRGARRALGAMALGSLLFLPWLPSFLEQMGSTGTPWGRPPKPRAVFDVVLQFGGGLFDTALPLGLLLYAFLALGLFGFSLGTRQDEAGPGETGPGGKGPGERGVVVLDLRGRPPGRMLAAVTGLTLVLAIVVGQITGSAFAIRYAAVVLPPVLLLAALGTATLAGTWAGPATLALAVVLGFVTATPSVFGDRTSAGRVAAALRAEAQSGDVVAYCPDQLGPSVSRLLRVGAAGGAPDLVEITFPRAGRPELVDWVGYEAANEAALTGPFARMLLDRAGPDRSVWVVWAPGYRTFGTKCQALLTDLRQARPDERRRVTVSTTTSERPGLVQYPPNLGGG